MGLEAATIAWIGLAVSAAGAGASYEQQRKAASMQRSAQRKQQRIREAQAQREKRQQLRKARIQQAQIAAQQELMGGSAGMPGSSAIGARSSVASQAAANVNFIDQMNELAGSASRDLAGAQAAAQQANIFDTASALAAKGTQLWGSTKPAGDDLIWGSTGFDPNSPT
jgi:hypothetical protein